MLDPDGTCSPPQGLMARDADGRVRWKHRRAEDTQKMVRLLPRALA